MNTKKSKLLDSYYTEFKSFLIGVGNNFPPSEAEYKSFLKTMTKISKQYEQLPDETKS